jgi:hypothetical protein
MPMEGAMNQLDEEKILLFLKELAKNEAFQQIVANSPSIEEVRREVEKRGYTFGLEELRDLMLKTFIFLMTRGQKTISFNVPSGAPEDEIFEMLEYSVEFGVPVRAIPLRVFQFLSGSGR